MQKVSVAFAFNIVKFELYRNDKGSGIYQGWDAIKNTIEII